VTADPLKGMTHARWSNLTEAQRHELRELHLHPALEDARAHRCRVEITYTDGRKERGYVSLTTGWRPAYILLHNARSIGSSNVLDPATVASVRRTYPIRRR
jgi:hypothetical protein